MDFFNKVGNKISSGANAVSTGTKKLVETNRINGQITQHQSQINNLYTEIGKIYYKKHMENPDEEFKAAFDEITKNQEAIEAAQIELRKIKGTKICDTCGNELPNEAAFCNKCGAQLPIPEPEVEQPSAKPMTCSCGAQLPPNAAFCAVCGKKVEIPEPVIPEPTVIPNTCKNCGAQYTTGAVFCASCGQKVSE